MSESADNESMANRAIAQHLGHAVDSNEVNFDILIVVRTLGSGFVSIVSNKGVRIIVEESGIALNTADALPSLGFEPSFFSQLSFGGLQWKLAGIDSSARNLDRNFFGTVSVLPNEHHFLIGRDRDDVDPIWRVNNVKFSFFSRGRA